MSRDPKLYLEDILEACDKINAYIEGVNSDSFHSDSKCVDAVLRNLEVIGEAAKSIPADVKEAHPEVEWRKIAAFRNIVAHEYFGIDHDIVWDVVQSKIPGLETQVRTILTAL